MAFVLNATFTLGLLGNLVSLLVILAPVRTFVKIYRKKSSEGFKSLPYLLSFSSAALSLYYALLRTDGYMLVGINAIGCVIQLIYIVIYFIYSTKKSKVFMMKLFMFNVWGLGLIMVVTFFLVKGPRRVAVVGWICAATNLAVFAAPLSVMRKVVRTKSVEYMPFALSFFLTISAVVWFFYGFFIKDYFVAIPNVTGFLLGTAQMVIYFVYKGMKQNIEGNAAEAVSKEVSDSGADHEKNGNLNVEVEVEVEVVVCK